MSTAKVLFIDSTHQDLPEGIQEMGFQVDYFTDYTPEQYEDIIDQYQGIIIRSKMKLDKRLLALAVNLKFIGRVGAGMENIDTKSAEKRGIICLNAPEGNRDAVGEHALGMLLMLMNKMRTAHTEICRGEWDRKKNRGFEIKGKTVGIIGYGNMGSAFAQRLAGFGAKVIAFDKYKRGFSDEYVQQVSLDIIFRDADILSLHVPLTKETNYMFDNAFISRFQRPFYLVNTARGPIVKTKDLLRNLQSGKILGAALDVLEFEGLTFENLAMEERPEAFRKLCLLDNVVLTPHVAGQTAESPQKMAQVMLKKIHDQIAEGNLKF